MEEDEDLAGVEVGDAMSIDDQSEEEVIPKKKATSTRSKAAPKKAPAPAKPKAKSRKLVSLSDKRSVIV
jgi:hypothetical protein